MLKRSVAILLMMLYLGTVSGFALNLHYCFNRLSSVKIDSPAPTCVKDLKSSKMKCCKDTHVDVKIKDAHQTGTESSLAKVFSFDIPKSFLPEFSVSIQPALTESLSYRGPPLVGGSPIFLRNCTFRI